MLTHALIKDRTASWHARVDGLFSMFDLSQRTPYASFLRANAGAIVPLETLLTQFEGLPTWDRRSSFLLDDLETVGCIGSEVPLGSMPEGFLSHGARFGALYVLEGSKFGAAVLSKRVRDGLPQGFLSVAAKPDRWRGLLNSIDAAASVRPPEWLDEVVAGATSAFDLFASSALKELDLPKHANRPDRYSPSAPSVPA